MDPLIWKSWKRRECTDLGSYDFRVPTVNHRPMGFLHESQLFWLDIWHLWKFWWSLVAVTHDRHMSTLQQFRLILSWNQLFPQYCSLKTTATRSKTARFDIWCSSSFRGWFLLEDPKVQILGSDKKSDIQIREDTMIPSFHQVVYIVTVKGSESSSSLNDTCWWRYLTVVPKVWFLEVVVVVSQG